MSKLSNALQGKLNSRKNSLKDSVKGLPERQLDLFSSLSDSSATRRTKTKPPAIPESKLESVPEVEMILPPPGEPPDVAAEVRAVLSESGAAHPVKPVQSSPDGRPPLRTGIYRRPQRPVASPPPSTPPQAPRSPSGPRRSPVRWMADFFSGLELNRRVLSLVIVLIVLVALIAFWTAPRGSSDGKLGTLLDLSAMEIAETEAISVPEPAAVVEEEPTAVLVTAWKVKGAVATQVGKMTRVRFTVPVFHSSDYISKEGMNALKAVAKKLRSMKGTVRVVVIGHSDNVPLSKPTARFKSNKELAGLRAKVAVDHLVPFTRANKGLEFEAKTGAPSEAPYPNDTSKNRRLNRTVTLEITPAS